MLNATWLETFTVLAETGHFTRAAQRLNMTQPGVSQHLRKLEGQVGKALIAQEGKRFSLTEAGEAIFALGQKRREEERHLLDRIATDDPEAGEVRLACSGSFALLLYPRLLALMAEAPALNLHLEAAPQARVLSGVLDNRFDLGIVGQDPAHPRLEATHLGQEELCLLLPKDMSAQDLSLARLDALGFVAHPDGYAYADDLFSQNFPKAFQGADRLRLRTTINQIGQIPEPVARGIGYTLLPRSGVDAFPRRDALSIADLPHRRYLGLWQVVRKGRPLSARLHRVAEIVADVARELQ
ncbi:LysR family transcriptional regulator [Antarctobacter jejuensis]|uniref:LysR family transcriptional regulator n=1 Tax=Antarctobacter jejuensis TaxID=1439938 RepID=UPI003FD072E6